MPGGIKKMEEELEAMMRLNPCQFCGSFDLEIDAVYYDWDNPSHFVLCNDCMARGPEGKNEEEAKKLWNRKLDKSKKD